MKKKTDIGNCLQLKQQNTRKNQTKKAAENIWETHPWTLQRLVGLNGIYFGFRIIKV